MNHDLEKAAQATKEDIKRGKRKCWNPSCKDRAWLWDWAGWHYCLKDWYRSWRWGGGEVNIRSFFWNMQHTRIGL